MRYVLVGRVRNYLGREPEERTWDFDGDGELARETHQVWSEWMCQGLWDFRDWGQPGSVTCIKPGAFYELDFRVIADGP
jgi:hypothetical protein